MVIIIEGVPGSGKTTTIEHVIKNIGREKILFVPEILPITKGSLNDFSFYLQNDKNKSQVLYENQRSVCLSDRYWQSTVVYKSVEYKKMSIESMMKRFQSYYPQEMFSEYFYIYLEADLEISLKKSALHDVESHWKERQFVAKTLKLYRTLYDNLERFDSKIRGKMCLNISELGYETIEKKVEEVIRTNGAYIKKIS